MNANNANNGAKQIIGHIVHHYKYITFPDNIQLKNVKILKAKARDSIWYIWYPYILELTYAKEWTETITTFMQIGKTTVPVTTLQYHTTKDYTFKYEKIEDIATKIREMRECNVKVENEIKPHSRHQ